MTNGEVSAPAPAASHAAALVLGADGSRRPIAAADILPAAQRGEVVLVPGALHRLGLHRQLADLIFDVVGDTSGAAQADECRRLGVEHLHEVLDGAQLERAVYEAGDRLALRYPRLMKTIVRDALAWRRPFYVHLSSLVRFIAPLHATERDPERFLRRKHVGRLGGHGPHRDNWFGFPINSINVWMAIGKVERDNGLLIFTQAWGKKISRHGDYALAAELGDPVRMVCDPGDLVVFHSRQAHASVVNVSSSTRVVMSGRLCLERPVAPTIEKLGTPCCYSPLIGTRFERLAQPVTKLSWVYAVERLKQKVAGAVGRVERKIGGAPLRFAGRVTRRALRYRRGVEGTV